MNRTAYFVRFGSIVLFVLSTLLCAEAYAYTPEWYEATYDSINDPQYDQCIELKLSDHRFNCDRAEFELTVGTLYLLPSVAGQFYSCIFSGTGRLRISPPTDIEQFSLHKHLKSDSIDIEFDKLSILASPSWIESVFDTAHGERASLSGKLRKFAENSNRFLRSEDWNVQASIAAELAGNAGSYVWIEIATRKKKRFFVEFSSLATESFRFYKRTSIHRKDYAEIVMSCFPLDHYDAGLSWRHRDVIRQVEPLKYTIDAEITERAHLRCKATLEFIPKIDSLRTLYSLIFDKTDVDSVLDAHGAALYVSKLEEEPGFTVFFDKPLVQSDTSQLVFYYHSDKIISKSPTGDFFIENQIYWYPIVEPLAPSRFDASFRCPRRLMLISVGENVVDSIAYDTNYTRWVTAAPETYCSFNYGLFDTLTIEDPATPVVRIYRGRTHTGDLLGPDMKKRVGEDVAGALKFFTMIYGDIPYDEIRVTEIPTSHGQGMPGLIHLPWGTFQSEEKIWDAQFRAHEVAHQWWGHLVRWESYHDQWMSEAFSEFSGAWYVQEKTRDYKKYFEILDVWRRDAIQKGRTSRGGWSEGTEAGPIWLGYRLASSKSQDYGALVYSKGGYVMHMLRCLMKDWPTGSDERFIAMMRDFVETYRGRAATTVDFQRVVERHIGEPMDWFFDQWIFGLDVPNLKFDKKVRREGDKFFVDAVVEQKKVPDGFKSIIPVRIDFGDDMWAVVRITAIGKRTETTIGPLPHRPKGFEFNFFKAVLSR